MEFSVAGESFRNSDGSDRQAEIARCRVGEAVTLVAEPDNPHDPDAIAVFSARGVQIGYVERAQAARIGKALAAGRLSDVEIDFIGELDRGMLGVRLITADHADRKAERMAAPPPPTAPSRPARSGFGGTGVKLVLLIFGVLVMVRFCAGDLPEPAATADDAADPAPRVATATLRQMVLEHARDADAANSRYSGFVEVAGLVDQVQITGGNALVWLDAGPGSRLNASLAIAASHSDNARRIRRGQIVTFTCAGVVRWIQNVPTMRDCAIDVASARAP